MYILFCLIERLYIQCWRSGLEYKDYKELSSTRKSKGVVFFPMRTSCILMAPLSSNWHPFGTGFVPRLGAWTWESPLDHAANK